MSNLLSQASLVMIPSGYKEDVVYSAVPTNGNGDLLFTRASNGTRVNSAGLVEVTPWNLVEYSEDFTNAYWNKYQSAVTSNSIVAPNGTTTADKFEYTTTGTAVLFATSSALSSQVYALSCYGKKGTTDILQIGFTLGTGDKIANFNLNTGVITTTSSGVTASIESVGNGWFRCVMSLTTDINTPNIFVNSTSGTTGNYIYIWGAQLNIGSTAKPYFPTTDRLNVPRLTYQNGGGGCPSLLLEKQSTNLYPYSEDLTQWTTSGSPTVTSNDSTSPDGTTNADRVQFSASGNLVYNNGTGSAGTNTLTVYAKAKTGTAQKFRFFANGATTVSSDFTATDQWQRFEYSYTFSAVTAGLQGASTGASDVLFWGFQHEVSSYATSYIGPTTSSSATRVADACFKTGISSLIGQTEGTLFADVIYDASILSLSGGSDQPIIAISDGTFQNYIAVLLQGSNDNRVISYCVTSGSTQAFIVSSAQTSGTIKIAVSYKSNYFALFVNGVKLGQDTSISIPATNSLNIGSYFSTASQFTTTLKETAIWKVQLTDAECIALTT